jgi:hypothetical protein
MPPKAAAKVHNTLIDGMIADRKLAGRRPDRSRALKSATGAGSTEHAGCTGKKQDTFRMKKARQDERALMDSLGWQYLSLVAGSGQVDGSKDNRGYHWIGHR